MNECASLRAHSCDLPVKGELLRDIIGGAMDEVFGSNQTEIVLHETVCPCTLDPPGGLMKQRIPSIRQTTLTAARGGATGWLHGNLTRPLRGCVTLRSGCIVRPRRPRPHTGTLAIARVRMPLPGRIRAMAQQISTEMRFPVDPETAYAMVTDPGYAQERAERTAGSDITISVSGTAPAPATVVSRRSLPVPDELPSFAKSMVGNGISVEETHTWGEPDGQGGRTAELTVLFPSLPVKVTGTMTLRGTDSGCVVAIDATVAASMPMVGGVIEQGVKGQVLRATSEEEKLALEWLAR
jgi:hypothetical protein